MKVHMSLPALDLEKTKEFYILIFGEEPIKTKPDYLKFDPISVPLNVSFHQVQSIAENETNRHLGFEFSDKRQFDSLYNRLKKVGLIVQERDESICCYANQDKFWVEDPSGFKWELYTLLEDTEKKMSKNSATNCCDGDIDESIRSCC